MQEETEELRNALTTQDQPKVEEELGDLLFAAVNLSRFLQIDPEIALKKANAKFSRRFRAIEKMARKAGHEFKDLPREEMEALWDATKDAEGEQHTTALHEAQARK
jgi:ATP diphosphatase